MKLELKVEFGVSFEWEIVKNLCQLFDCRIYCRIDFNGLQIEKQLQSMKFSGFFENGNLLRRYFVENSEKYLTKLTL